MVPKQSEAEKLVLQALADKLNVLGAKDVKTAVKILADGKAQAAVLIPRNVPALAIQKGIMDTFKVLDTFEVKEGIEEPVEEPLPNFTADDVQKLIDQAEIKDRVERELAPFREAIDVGRKALAELKKGKQP